jgi:hypothetical protein
MDDSKNDAAPKLPKADEPSATDFHHRGGRTVAPMQSLFAEIFK